MGVTQKEKRKCIPRETTYSGASVWGGVMGDTKLPWLMSYIAEGKHCCKFRYALI